MKKIFCDVCGREIQIAYEEWTLNAKSIGGDKIRLTDICAACITEVQDLLIQITNRRERESR